MIGLWQRIREATLATLLTTCACANNMSLSLSGFNSERARLFCFCLFSFFFYIYLKRVDIIVPRLDNDQRNWKWEWRNILTDSRDLEIEMRKHLWLSHSIILTHHKVSPISRENHDREIITHFRDMYVCHTKCLLWKLIRSKTQSPFKVWWCQQIEILL